MMIVLDHEPHAWFLLEDTGGLYLDAFCTHSFLDYSVLIALNDAETAAYRAKGRTYIDQLAYDIHYSAPAARGSNSPFKSRNLTILNGPEAKASSAAIVAWLAKRRDI